MFASLVLIGAMLIGQSPPATATAANALRTQVHALVRKLDSASLPDRTAAEEELLALGPQVLDLLPEPNEDMSAEVKERLGRIRQKLQQQSAEAAAQASPITLHDPAMRLSKILAEMQKQSGNAIVDARRQSGPPPADPELKVDFDKTPFWRALDDVLDRAGLGVYAFGQQRGINVVSRSRGHSPRGSHASYSGPFRFEPVRIVASRDLRVSAGGALTLAVEVAWEPRLRPIGLKQRMADVTARDENGHLLAVDDPKTEIEAIMPSDAAAVELDLSLALPPQRVKEIASFRGSLRAMVPGKIETFRFSDLLTAKNVEKRIAGATVTLEQVRKNDDLWEVRIRVRFDDAGNALESFRGWILQNDAYLEDPQGKTVSYGRQTVTHEDKNGIGLAYLFQLKEPPRHWKFVYKTPGVIVTTALPYEFKGIKLP